MAISLPDTVDVPTDDRLVALVRDGDATGLGVLYDRFAPRMLRVAWRLTGSQSDAEDVVHDVFVTLPGTLRRYEHRGALGSWLTQVTARAALMHLRTQRRRRESDLADAGMAVSDARTDAAAECVTLERHIAALPDGLRAVFVLREIEGFTHDDIAGMLGITAGASRVRLTRALAALRTALTPPTPSVAAATLRP
jgi:RNA polymerase sigma-70 factor, ECF subfamily